MLTKIGSIIDFEVGINQSRAKSDISDKLYDNTSFDKDYYKQYISYSNKVDKENDERYVLRSGDVIISTVKQQATIVSDEHDRLIYGSNFFKVIFSNQEVDKAYFVYLFNANRDVQRQKERSTQSTLTVSKLSSASMKEIEIPIVSPDEQVRIGMAYLNMLYLRSKLERYSELIEMMTCNVLDDALGGEEDDI